MKSLFLFAVFLLVLLVSLFFGATTISLSALTDIAQSTPEGKIFWELRFPRVCLAFCVGAGLSLGGAVFQSLFRNVLASPYTLGISSGAALGQAIALHIGLIVSSSLLWGALFGSLLGVGVTLSLLLVASYNRSLLSGNGLLLVGVVLNLFLGSLILFLQYISDFSAVLRTLRWIMGSFDVVGFSQAVLVACFVGGAFLYALLKRHELDLLSFGDELAGARGVNIVQEKRRFLIVISVMIGVIVSVCGPIGFIGIIVPHICRLLAGARHGALLPALLLFGGGFLVACDLLSRTLIAPYEIPVGVITSLLGGPFFVWVLLSGPRKST